MKFPFPTRFTSLRTRLSVLYAGLFAVVMLGVSAALWVVVERNAQRQVERELEASGTVFDRLWAQRSERMRDAAELLARDYGFRAAVATHDRGTTESALANLKQRLRFPLAFIVDVDGNVVGLENPRTAAQARDLAGQLDNDAVVGVTSLGGVPRQLVAAPIMAPALVGWVVFATDLDAREMRGLERLSAIPLSAAVYQRRPDGRWVGGNDQTAPASVAEFFGRASGVSTPSLIERADGTAIALHKTLPAMAGSPSTVLLLQYPLARALAPYRPLRWAIALLTLGGLVVVVFATWRMARSITRPVSLLDDAVGRLAEGNSVIVPIASEDEIGRLARSFNHMANEIVERERRITHLVFNDPLTGLPNRALFADHLERALRQVERRGGSVALFCLDLDHFKTINDTLGHTVGDELLRLVARRLVEMDDDMFIARFGGDEFVVVRELGGGDLSALAVFGRRVIDVVSAPTRIGAHEIEPRVSIGVAVGPNDGVDGGALLKNADLALHQAKEAGRHTLRFFEPALDAQARMRRAIEIDLRRALVNGELELHFQPLLNLATSRVTAFEALLRWHHPTRGLVSPAEFIPIAEETGLIVPVGAWVMREACATATRWPADVRVAVNVSSVQVRRPGLAQVIAQALQTSGLQPSRLEVEITESVFLAGTDETTRLLHELRALGLRIALDDFGTGYSSLSYLQSFPFDKMKVDRSFVAGLAGSGGDGAIVQAILDLASALRMETTAEGVETEAQLAELKRRGCNSIQGYLLSRPVPASGVEALLRDTLHWAPLSRLSETVLPRNVAQSL